MKLTTPMQTLLFEHIQNGYIRSHKINNDLTLYKYTQKTSFDRKWDDITIMCRGIILDNEFNVIGNCMPKFFNYEELISINVPDINLNQPFTVTEKCDGSLIQVFMYNGEMIITSSGSSNNEYTMTAERLLNTKYINILPIINATDCVNFIFELIAPLTKVVVNYKNIEELRLITIRNSDGAEDNNFIQFCRESGFDYVSDLHFNSLDELLNIKNTPFNNAEGFVIKFEDGSRVKIKFDEYFILHKSITKANKLYVWDCMSNNIQIDYELLPDEVFDDVKIWTKELISDFDNLLNNVLATFDNIKINTDVNDRKKVAMYIMENHQDISKFLFSLLDGKDITSLIWKTIKPKNMTGGVN